MRADPGPGEMPGIIWIFGQDVVLEPAGAGYRSCLPRREVGPEEAVGVLDAEVLAVLRGCNIVEPFQVHY